MIYVSIIFSVKTKRKVGPTPKPHVPKPNNLKIKHNKEKQNKTKTNEKNRSSSSMNAGGECVRK